jgi:hypothetical protein
LERAGSVLRDALPHIRRCKDFDALFRLVAAKLSVSSGISELTLDDAVLTSVSFPHGSSCMRERDTKRAALRGKELLVLKNDPAFEYSKELGSTAQASASK